MTIHYRNILEQQSTAILLLDESLRLVYLNQAAEALLAISQSRSKGETLSCLLLGDPSFEQELHHALQAQQSFTRRVTTLRAPQAGSEITIDYTVTPIQDAGVARLLVEMQPLDRFLRINREATQLALQRTTKELIRGMAHEIKNPLGGIRGSAQLLARALDAPDLREYTDIIIEEADRLRGLVDRMLGPKQLPRFQRANLHRILERVRQLIEAELPDRIRFERDYDPSIPEFVCDPDQLLQAFLNVVRNAAQALQGTEIATIRMRSRTLRQYTIGNERYRLVAKIDIIDNGPGIPEDMIDRLFYPMISGRAEGSGLGLSITQSIVTQHGGLIECNSAPGKTQFSFLLPMECTNENA